MFGERFADRQCPATLVLGLGESGLAMARWCARHGCRVRIADTRSTPPNLSRLNACAIEAEFVPGTFTQALLDGGIELVAISPGLSPFSAELAPLIAAAHAREIPVWGELEFFSQALKTLAAEGYRPKVLAVTGTNGKTTTASLSGLLCEHAGQRVALAGNIGPALLDKLAAVLDSTALPDVWVLELSSFQLETAVTFDPDAAAILNITQDHLDWHGGLDAYAAAKGRIFGPSTLRVLNRDDTRVMAFASSAQPHGQAVPHVAFGIDVPLNSGDYGIQRDAGLAWLVRAQDRNDGVQWRATGRRRKAGKSVPDIMVKRLMPVDALPIRGLHNAANAMVALALTQSIGLPLAALLHGLREYRGEPHRVEWIASVGGIDYVDDSKGTNVGATAAALDGLAQRAVLIAGGDGKGQDFAPLAAPVARWCRAVMLIGRDVPLLRAALEDTGVMLAEHSTLEAATHAAAALAKPGDVVLLSPACASFDMFTGYAHRAQVFRHAIEEIAAQQEGAS